MKLFYTRLIGFLLLIPVGIFIFLVLRELVIQTYQGIMLDMADNLAVIGIFLFLLFCTWTGIYLINKKKTTNER